MIPWELLKPTQWFAAQVAISGVLVSGLALLGARVLRRSPAPLRYRILFSGILGLLAIPFLVALGNAAASNLIPPGEEVVKVSPEMLPALLNPAPPEPPVASEATFGAIATAIALAGWMSIALLGVARLLIGLWRQHRIILGPAWSADWWTDERRTALAEKLGLARFPDVHMSPNVPIPMVAGLFRPRIVLPEAPAAWGRQQWEAVLMHEAAHIARRDPWAMLAQALAVILFWWCPFAHRMARRLNDLREAICDDYALEGPCDQFAYVELLVESAERLVNVRATPVTAGLLDSARSGLEERISRLLEKERKPMKPLSFAGKVLGASLLAVACLLIPGAAAYSQAPAPKVQIKIVLDGKEIDLTDANIAAILQAVQAKVKAAPDGVRFRVVPDNKGILELGIQEAKPDPRIEELVRKAEAIKPGSGAEIRRMLARKLGTKEITLFPTPQVPAGAGAKAFDARIIILRMDPNGKIVQLQESELGELLQKKTAEKNLHFRFDNISLQPLRIEVKPVPPAPKAKAPEKGIELELMLQPGIIKPVTKPLPMPIVGGNPAPATKKAAPAQPAADVAELSRQIERLHRELQELRSRLDTQKQAK
ncbi:MAG TPA: M56 family metallopeptidase [Gemmataceae bacterium]|nr:M56 family metallopeptidase [Gemmataceae bacterium]